MAASGPPNPNPALNLLAGEEAARLQEQLIERGYLLGPADGVWGPRSHAALEDFRRAPGLEPDDGWTKKTETVLGSERPQEAGPPAIAEARALVQEEAVPPPRPRALRSGLDDQAVSNLPPNGGDTAPEPRPAAMCSRPELKRRSKSLCRGLGPVAGRLLSGDGCAALGDLGAASRVVRRRPGHLRVRTGSAGGCRLAHTGSLLR